MILSNRVPDFPNIGGGEIVPVSDPRYASIFVYDLVISTAGDRLTVLATVFHRLADSGTECVDHLAPGIRGSADTVVLNSGGFFSWEEAAADIAKFRPWFGAGLD